VWYFRTVPTVWYFTTVPTVWYSLFFILFLIQKNVKKCYYGMQHLCNASIIHISTRGRLDISIIRMCLEI
jgi:hypothetical protein